MNDGIMKAEHAGILDSAGRIRELRPLELLRDVGGVTGGETGIDLGSGTGVFTLALAQLAGATGRVFAVDNKDVMHDHLRSKDPPATVEFVTADVTATGLPAGIADVCVATFILHEINDPQRIVDEAARLLKPGGRLVIMDWRADVHNFGPSVSKRITRPQVMEYAERAGLRFDSYLDWTENHFAALAVKS